MQRKDPYPLKSGVRIPLSIDRRVFTPVSSPVTSGEHNTKNEQKWCESRQ